MFAEDPTPASLRSRLLVPIVATYATADLVVEHIRAKVHKYRELAASRGVALVVVLAADEHGGLDVGLVESTLAGQNSISLTFDIFERGPVVAGPPVPIRMNDHPPKFDPVISAVAWIDTLADEPALTVWRQPNATVPLPELS